MQQSKSESADPAAIARVHAALAAGRPVALPTESNVVIAAPLWARDALAGLAKPAGSGFTALVADKSPLDEDIVPPPAMRLVNRYWPGPMTLRLPSSALRDVNLRDAWPAGGRLTMRCPAHDATLGVLRAHGAPLAAIDAKGPSGFIYDPADLPAELRARLGAVLAPARKGMPEPPAAVEWTAGGIEVGHEGILNRSDIFKTAGRRILFVCTGNTCRSPMAMAYLRTRIVERLGGPRAVAAGLQLPFLSKFGYRIESAGLAPYPGSPASPAAVAAAAEYQCSLEGHESQVAEPELIEQFDVVLALTDAHARRLLAMAPGHVRIEPLDPDRDIQDPFGGTLESYRMAFSRIREAIDRRFESLL
jgi:protein-tyrosine phosphatase